MMTRPGGRQRSRLARHPESLDNPGDPRSSAERRRGHGVPRGVLASRTRRSPTAAAMNLEKVIFGFFIILACTLNFGFFFGEIDNPEHHDVYELMGAVVVNLIATVLKFGDRTHIGATHLATSLVASLQLVAGALVWTWQLQVAMEPISPHAMATIVSLSGGALVANLISVTLLIGETLRHSR
jgi:hypothetical protein